MNDATVQFLKQLASQLGTTVDKIWAILIAQQRINAIESILCIALFSIAGFALYKLHLKLLKKVGRSGCPIYEENDLYAIVMGGAAIMWGIFCCLIIFSVIPNMIDEFMNPQYTALKFILSNIAI